MMKIPKKMMDPIDAQQQDDIERATNLAWGAMWVTLIVTVLNFGAFVFAMSEMGNALKLLEKMISQ